ncbi:MAG: HDOD domain-containing protein [Phycisphaeraceae bacterium]
MHTILIVEDMPIISQPIEAALRREGFATVCACNGLDGLAKLGANPVDLVLLDVGMPVMDGISFLERIRKEDRYALLPVIMLTAAADRERVIQAAKLRVTGYLLKSNFSLRELVVKVRLTLGAAQERHPETQVRSPEGEAPGTRSEERGTRSEEQGPWHEQAPASPAAPAAGMDVATPAPAPPSPALAREASAGGATPISLANMLTRSAAQAARDGREDLKSIKPLLTRSQVQEFIDGCEQVRAFSPAVTQVLKISSNPDCSIDRLVRAISQDHAIALKILKLANSVVYSRGEPVESIHAAVTRIGLDRIRQAVLNLGVIEHFSNAAIAQYLSFAHFWEHAIGCGLIAAELAHRLGEEKLADRAFTMGLLHDMGRLVYVEQMGDRYAQVLLTAYDLELPLEQVESRMLLINHADVMDRVLHAWKFSPHLIKPIVHHHLSVDNIRQVSPRELREVAILCLANRLAHALMLGSSGNHVIYPTQDFCRVLKLDPSVIREVAALAPGQTRDMKFTMLSRSNGSSWTPLVNEYRTAMPAGFRPLVIAPELDADAYAIFCQALALPSEEGPPNVAIVHLAYARHASELSDALKEAEGQAGVTGLPLLILSPTGQGVLDGDVMARPHQMLTTPLVVSRFIRAVATLTGRALRDAA